MTAILLEGVLFVVAIAAGAALLVFGVMNRSSVILRLRQVQNRKRIERAAELVCPAHGPHTEEQLVRLPGGDRICPDCFQEAVDGKLD
ncbi:MAG: hypothetical protein M3068_14620 [Gemmatimonadota bacterium]|nr:hypothetical protein [Gemmatimonadota bacterium]